MAGSGIMTAIGLMSGTSMDGIDVALLRTDGISEVSTGPNLFVPYDPAFRRRLETSLETAKAIVRREDRPGDLAAVEHEVTGKHAEAVALFLRDNALAAADIDLLGFHGQTVLHRPLQGVTVQLGDGKELSRQTGMPVVYDMRANDMRHGGQGAPLVPAYHAALAKARVREMDGGFPVCFVNIGGISNITYVPWEGEPVAFDTGPGNALIDQWVSREGGVPYDESGVIASEGGVVESVVRRYLDKPFFSEPGPKSLDRNDFTLAEVGGLELADGARTLAAVSAAAILRSAELMPEAPKLWVVCGGGRKNPHIVGDLRDGAAICGGKVLLAEDLDMNGDFTEAEAWAYLAVRSLGGLALTFPKTTGCRMAVTGGIVVGRRTAAGS